MSGLLLCTSAAALAGDVLEVPPFKVLPEEGDPAHPEGLHAEGTSDGWAVSWEAVAAPPTAEVSYQLHVWRPETGWTSQATTQTDLELGPMAAGGIITVTALATYEGGASHESAAGQFLVISNAYPCPPVTVWTQPPPPGAEVDLECIG